MVGYDLWASILHTTFVKARMICANRTRCFGFSEYVTQEWRFSNVHDLIKEPRAGLEVADRGDHMPFSFSSLSADVKISSDEVNLESSYDMAAAFSTWHSPDSGYPNVPVWTKLCSCFLFLICTWSRLRAFINERIHPKNRAPCGIKRGTPFRRTRLRVWCIDSDADGYACWPERTQIANIQHVWDEEWEQGRPHFSVLFCEDAECTKLAVYKKRWNENRRSSGFKMATSVDGLRGTAVLGSVVNVKQRQLSVRLLWLRRNQRRYCIYNWPDNCLAGCCRHLQDFGQWRVSHEVERTSCQLTCNHIHPASSCNVLNATVHVVWTIWTFHRCVTTEICVFLHVARNSW